MLSSKGLDWGARTEVFTCKSDRCGTACGGIRLGTFDVLVNTKWKIVFIRQVEQSVGGIGSYVELCGMSKMRGCICFESII